METYIIDGKAYKRPPKLEQSKAVYGTMMKDRIHFVGCPLTEAAEEESRRAISYKGAMDIGKLLSEIVPEMTKDLLENYVLINFILYEKNSPEIK